jgi:hypothetical protein
LKNRNKQILKLDITWMDINKRKLIASQARGVDVFDSIVDGRDVAGSFSASGGDELRAFVC